MSDPSNFFQVHDATWTSIGLFGPLGRSFGVFIHHTRQTSKEYRVTFIDAHGASCSLDVYERLGRAGADLTRLQQRAAHPNESRQAALDYLDFLLWLEAFLFFLLHHGFPSFLHSNLISEIPVYHKATFPIQPNLPADTHDDVCRADLRNRREAYQASYPRPSHVPPESTAKIMQLPADWADPRAAPCPEKVRGVLDPRFGLIFKPPSSLGPSSQPIVPIPIQPPSRHAPVSHEDDIVQPLDRKRKASEMESPLSQRTRDAQAIFNSRARALSDTLDRVKQEVGFLVETIKAQSDELLNLRQMVEPPAPEHNIVLQQTQYKSEPRIPCSGAPTPHYQSHHQPRLNFSRLYAGNAPPPVPQHRQGNPPNDQRPQFSEQGDGRNSKKMKLVESNPDPLPLRVTRSNRLPAVPLGSAPPQNPYIMSGFLANHQPPNVHPVLKKEEPDWTGF